MAKLIDAGWYQPKECEPTYVGRFTQHHDRLTSANRQPGQAPVSSTELINIIIRSLKEDLR